MYKKYLFLSFLISLGHFLFAQNKLDIDFRTGDDNLEKMEFQDNPEVRILLNGKPDLVRTNINRGQTWPNQSLRRITIPLPADLALEDIREIQIARLPKHGRQYVWDYLKKDNWTLKGLTVTATFVTDGVSQSFDLYAGPSRGNVFRFVYEGGDNIREGTVFNAKLEPKTGNGEKEPVSENLVITATFLTGNDNLEGGSNNVDIILYRSDDPGVITIPNVNRGRKWNNNSEHTIRYEVPGSSNMDITRISKVVIQHTGGGGTFADNWNLNRLKMVGELEGQKILLVDKSGSYLHRFTGESRTKEFIVPGRTGQLALYNAQLTAVFGTGSDNLEGGQTNNVDIMLYFRDRSGPVYLRNLNDRQKWENNTVHTVKRDIPESFSLDINDITKVVVRHTGGGGMGADNWNLDQLKLTVTKGDQTKVLVDKVGIPIMRFTGERRQKEFSLE